MNDNTSPVSAKVQIDNPDEWNLKKTDETGIKDKSVTADQALIEPRCDKEFPFLIYPMDEGVWPSPPFFRKSSPTMPLTYYVFHSCEGHAYQLLSKLISQGIALTPRAQHAATLFLMSATHLARNMELDIHRTSIWLSIVWQCFLLISHYRTRDHIHLDRYFEETLIRHCVNNSQGCEVFSADEARVLQRFFCRFTRLLPLLQLYLFKVFDIEFIMMEKKPYLRGKDCTSEINLQLNDMTLTDPMLRMEMGNRPKRNKNDRELFTCSKEYFRRLSNQITENDVKELLSVTKS